MLRAQDLWKRYGDNDVVKGVSCELKSGEILGFLGPNGAGKTTTVGMLYGAVLPSRGKVTFLDWEIPRDGREARAAMGIVTQEDNLDPDFSVVENLMVFAHHYCLRGKAAQARCNELIEKVGLTTHRDYKPDDLSGGLKRRLVLARALINNPKVIFLDEPTTGLDPDSRQAFWKIVSNLRSEGCGIVLTTHYMDEAQRLCDRLILMQNGERVDDGTPAELIERVAGHKVVEVEGIEEEQLKQLDAQQVAWMSPFGTGFLIGLPAHGSHDCTARLEQLQPSRLTVRAANLEDVFIRLTGANLNR